jgi:hypothetical protein
MITTQNDSTLRLNVLTQLDHFNWIGAIAHHIAQDDLSINGLIFGVDQTSLKSLQIAVNIRK